MKKSIQVHLRVWGDWACFTRPEMKVERVSYPVMTPSAARGILEAIFWEPQFCYFIVAIRVVRQGRWTTIRRNEIQKKTSLDAVQKWMLQPEKFQPIAAGGGAGTQRSMLALQEVEYIISAEIRTTALVKRPGDVPAQYFAEFKRRAQKGKCFHRPALGLREFAADFEWVEDAQMILEQRTASYLNEDLGIMLYDVFPPQDRVKGKWVKPKACFFHAKLRNSILACHPNEVGILIA